MLIHAVVIGDPEKEDFRVAGDSDHKKLSRAIKESFNSNKGQVLSAVGAGAINCAIKAVSTVRGDLTRGPMALHDVYARLSWFDADSGGDVKLSGVRIEPIYVIKIIEG